MTNLAVDLFADTDIKAGPRLEFLRDGQGIYGLTIPPVGEETDVLSLIVRPDKLGDVSPKGLMALQRVNQLPIFRGTAERALVRRLIDVRLCRAGLKRGDWEAQGEWWADNDRDRAANRRRYFANLTSAWRIANARIGQLLEAAADQDVLRLARRFTISCRAEIYYHTANSSRMRQLAQIFPALALVVARGELPNSADGPSFLIQTVAVEAERTHDARRLVERGAPLAEVAEAVGLGMALRKVPPGAAEDVIHFGHALKDNPELIHAYLPSTTPAAKRWWRAIGVAESYGPPFVEWTARNATALGRTKNEVCDRLQDIRDWVRASYAAGIPSHVVQALSLQGTDGAEFVTRPFSSDMSLRTVIGLSHDWHEAVAANMTGPNLALPDPWCEGDTINGYTITPLTTSADLYREGKTMHNCVGTYVENIRFGGCYIFSVTKNGARTATVELVNNEGRPELAQVRAPCNATADRQVKRAVRRWLSTRPSIKITSLIGWPHQQQRAEGAEFDTDIPF